MGDGDPKKAPPELIAVLGDVGFRCKGAASKTAYSPSGKLLAVQGKGCVELFDATSARYLRSIVDDYPRLVFSPTSESVILIGDGASRQYDIATGRRSWPELPYHDALAYTPDGKLVATGSLLTDGIKVYTTADRKPVPDMVEDLKSFRSVEFTISSRAVRRCPASARP